MPLLSNLLSLYTVMDFALYSLLFSTVARPFFIISFSRLLSSTLPCLARESMPVSHRLPIFILIYFRFDILPATTRVEPGRCHSSSYSEYRKREAFIDICAEHIYFTAARYAQLHATSPIGLIALYFHR